MTMKCFSNYCFAGKHKNAKWRLEISFIKTPFFLNFSGGLQFNIENRNVKSGPQF